MLDIPLIFEDDYLAVISKPAGLVVHAGHGKEDETVVSWLLSRYGRDGLADMSAVSACDNHLNSEQFDRPGIVHRLDKNTSGLMLVAKTDETGYLLQEMIRLHKVDRHYQALVHGIVKPQTGLIDVPLARSLRHPTLFEAAQREHSRNAQTELTVLERFADTTLLDLKLLTGRTHQIRVHCKFIGHPVVGDPDYFLGKKPGYDYGLKRQFLHSYSLDFVHPITDEKLHFADKLPDDLQRVLDTLK